ncbi:MAG: glucosaminidase domain-containing protein [Sneathiella sp.]
MAGNFALKALGGCILSVGIFMGHPALADTETIKIRSFDEFATYFEQNGYSIQKWKQGAQDVPAYVILDIPEEWRKKVAPDMPVDEKKRTFFRLAIPLAFVANHGISQDQQKLRDLEKVHRAGKPLDKADAAWLNEQAVAYAIDATELNDQFWANFRERMDIIPPSLIVAQMVEESGWGTSRFASEGNALFGQWSYTGGIKPEEPRENKGDYRIEAFKTPLDSVRAYMLNLNSHMAYADFRKRRAALRAKGKPVTGPALVGTLTEYSERREAYVRIIEGIMEHNSLPPLDHVRLASGEVTYLELE